MSKSFVSKSSMLKTCVPLSALLLVVGCSSGDSASSTTEAPAQSAPPSSIDLEYVPATIQEIFDKNDIFSTFAELVSLTDLAPLFSEPSQITVLVLPNAAFDRLPAGTVDALKDPANREVLTRILSYLMLDGKVLEAEFANGPLTMKSGDTVQVDVGPDVGYMMNVSFNGVKMLVGDLIAGDGVAHVLQDLILPPGVDLASL